MQFSNTTSSADPDDPLLPPAREIGAFFLAALPGVCLGLLLALTLPSLSATRMQTWPWAGFAAAFWSVPIFVALGRLALARPHSRLGPPLDLAFAALALTGLCSLLLSPLRPALAPHLLPFLGALALPYALLPLVHRPRFSAWACGFLWPLLLVAGLRWLLSVPSWSGPYPRNAEPFGHANISASVFVLAAGAFTLLAARAPRLPARLLHAIGAVCAAALALSTHGRGGVLALAAGGVVAAGFLLLRRGRTRAFLLSALLVLAAALLANDRFRDVLVSGQWSAPASESNAQRMAMIQGGLLLAAERPLTGWGPGAVPHAFPRVRADLPGEPDNYLQLHNTPAQLAATLGAPGLLAAALLALGLALRLRRQPDAALAATLAAGATLLLFDHSFSVPAFAVLAALPVALLAPPPAAAPAPFRRPGPRHIAALALLATGFLLLSWNVVRDLASRAAWSSALVSATYSDMPAFSASLHRAHRLSPASPALADQLASHLATGHPFPEPATLDPAAAALVLETSLDYNPDLEAARYNLGWLLLSADPAAARAHLAAAARLAPARAGVHLGHAVACIRLSDTEAAVRSLAAEILLDPTFAWSPMWHDPLLREQREPALDHASRFLETRRLAPAFAARLRDPGPPLETAPAYRRLRTGHGVLFAFPDGPPPADVPRLLRVTPPPSAQPDLPPDRYLAPALLLECADL